MNDKKPFSFSRRQFLDTAVKVTAGGTLAYVQMSGCGSEASEVTPPPENKHVFLSKPYLHTLQHDRMSIRWITNKPSFSWIEYGEAGKLDKKAMLVVDGMLNAYNRIHEIYLENLEPGKSYQYRVASKEITEFKPYEVVYGETIYSDAYTFTTIVKNPIELSWLILNDLHDRPDSFPHLLQLNLKDPYDFVFLNGDMFNYQTDEQQIIDHLLIPCTNDFATEKPMLFVRGNHEARGKFARELKNYFSFPQGQYFTFHWGPVFAIVLDTGEDKKDDNPVYAGLVDFDAYRIQQAIWMEKLMQTPEYINATYKVVLMHIPPFYSKDQHGELHCRELFSPLFDKYKVDIVIAGHTHTYGVHPPVKNQHGYPIIIGGGPEIGKRTLIKVKADQQQLIVQMLNDDNKVVGTYTVAASV